MAVYGSADLAQPSSYDDDYGYFQLLPDNSRYFQVVVKWDSSTIDIDINN